MKLFKRNKQPEFNDPITPQARDLALAAIEMLRIEIQLDEEELRELNAGRVSGQIPDRIHNPTADMLTFKIDYKNKALETLMCRHDRIVNGLAASALMIIDDDTIGS